MDLSPSPGSFQRGPRFESENPLEELWSHIALLASEEHLKDHSHPASPNLDWNRFIKYAVVRVRQAIEFRNSARDSSLLTLPLMLYYSALNLMRAALALNAEVISRPAHGLRFQRGPDLLRCYATLCDGTFTDYLGREGASWKRDVPVSLQDALSRIIEIHDEYRWIVKEDSLVVPVKVEVSSSREVFLRFFGNLPDFRTWWRRDFPNLSRFCTAETEESVLKLNENVNTDEAVADLCNKELERALVYRQDAPWYLIRNVNPDLAFPRPAYYLVALFILGSVVRYQPELMLESVRPDSELGWLLKRFAKAAERFYPQLVYSWMRNQPVYF